jgi:hypothetical protein
MTALAFMLVLGLVIGWLARGYFDDKAEQRRQNESDARPAWWEDP